jgi:hypothetical protein
MNGKELEKSLLSTWIKMGLIKAAGGLVVVAAITFFMYLVRNQP